jgi:hypothetical protein
MDIHLNQLPVDPDEAPIFKKLPGRTTTQGRLKIEIVDRKQAVCEISTPYRLSRDLQSYLQDALGDWFVDAKVYELVFYKCSRRGVLLHITRFKFTFKVLRVMQE